MRMRVSRITAGRQPLAQPLDDGGEGVLLDEVEQLLLGLEVIIKTGQRDAAEAREVAHRRAFVAFFGKDLGGVVEDLGQTAVEARVLGGSAFGARVVVEADIR